MKVKFDLSGRVRALRKTALSRDYRDGPFSLWWFYLLAGLVTVFLGNVLAGDEFSFSVSCPHRDAARRGGGEIPGNAAQSRSVHQAWGR
jgi:hypothetical protein